MVAQQLNTETNSKFTGEECEKKFCNLFQTYKQNKAKRLKSTGETPVTWKYYNIFDEVKQSISYAFERCIIKVFIRL